MSQITENETTDEVIRETRRIKEALAREMSYDVDQILEDAREKQIDGGRNVLSPPVRGEV